MSGRVRVDPGRTVGNANLLATGHEIGTFATVSEQTLARYEDLANNAALAAQEARRAEMQTKSDASKARMDEWGDTLLAKRKQYLVDRANRFEVEEMRRQKIDAEEAEFREAQRQRRLHDANMQILHREERGRVMRSAVLAHEVRQEVEWQLSMQAEKKAQLEEDARQYAEAVKKGAEMEQQEKIAAAQAIKDKLLAVKQEQYAMLEDAIERRRAEKKQIYLDADEIRRAAEAEAQENSARREQRRVAEKAFREEIARQISPRMSPRQKLQHQQEQAQTVLQQHASPDAAAIRYEQFKEEQRKALDMLVRSRQEKHESRVALATESLSKELATSNKKESTVDAFSSVPSMSARLIEQSDLRERTIAQHKREVTAAPSPRTMRSTLGMATETAVERNYNELRSPRYRERLDHQLTMMEVFDQQARLAAKQDAQYLAMVHQMQAAEKRHQRELEKAQDIEEALRRREGLAEEDALFREFVEAHLPEKISPRLAKTARGQVGHGGKYMGGSVGRSMYSQ